MAYLPPHKRHSKDSPKPTPIPPSIISKFNQTLILGGSSKPNSRKGRDRKPPQNQGNNIIYAANSISRWFIAGSDSSILRLGPLDCEVFERKNGAKPMVLEGAEGKEMDDKPWVKIAERIENDLIDCYWSAIEGLKSERELIKFSFVARMGRVLFDGNSVDLETIKKAAFPGTDSRKEVRKTFYTDVSSVYMEELQHLVSKIGFDFHSEKEHYLVRVLDKSRPESTILCTCIVANDGGVLDIHKIQLNQVRHLVVDISCPYKDLDLRLMLLTKRIIKSLDDEENDGINKMIKSAVIDPNVKGGLRWPLGKESEADRFSIVGVWHTKCKAFKSQTSRIKLRHADRFDHMTSTGEVSTEVTLKLTGISKHLRDGKVEKDLIKEMVQEEVKLIWDHFLSYNHPST